MKISKFWFDFFFLIYILQQSRFNKPFRHHNDIALIRVKHHFQFSNKVAPIKFSKQKLDENVKLTLTGFGRTKFKGKSSDKLSVINLRQLSMEKCNKQFRDYNKKRKLPLVTFGAGHLCTFNRKLQGICFGDR